MPLSHVVAAALETSDAGIAGDGPMVARRGFGAAYPHVAERGGT